MTSKLGPSLELQTAILAVWAADADVKSLFGGIFRFYQDVPANPTFPYVTAGEGQTVPDLAECIDGSEVFPDFHIWSRGKGFNEAKTISATLWSVLSEATLSLTENRCLLIERESETHLRDPDGTTKHIVLTLRALTEPAA